MRRYNPHSVYFLAAILMLWVALLKVPPVIAAPSEKDSQESQWSEEMVRQRAAEAAAAIKQARQAVSNDNARALGVELNDLQTRVRQWVELESAYEGLLTEIKRKAEQVVDAGTDQQNLESIRRKALPEPPYPLSYYDELLVETETLRQNIDITDMALNAAQRSAAESRMQLNSAQDRLERFRRRSDPRQSPPDRWEMEGLQLRVQLVETLRRLHLQRSENIQLQKQQAATRAERITDLAERVRAGLAYDQADLDRQLNTLSQMREEVDKAL